VSQTTITQQLYAALTQALAAGWSINRIAEAAGASRPSIQDWYTGSRSGLKLETASALAAFFGMRLTKPRIPSAADPGGEIPEPNRKPRAKKANRKPGR
jgi:transcriptional regulator with XRE-family HTH domain